MGLGELIGNLACGACVRQIDLGHAGLAKGRSLQQRAPHQSPVQLTAGEIRVAQVGTLQINSGHIPPR